MRALIVSVVLATIALAQQPTTYGGPHLRLTPTPHGASLEFDCASGTLTQPLPTKNGTHILKGTLLREHGGPVRLNEPAAAPTDYKITRRGNQLTLEVNGETYTLTKGARGSVMKCK